MTVLVLTICATGAACIEREDATYGSRAACEAAVETLGELPMPFILPGVAITEAECRP